MQVIVERDAESNNRQRKLGRCECSLDQQNDQWFEFRQG